MTTPINIGALTAATTIADTDLVPLVQAGVTKRVDVGTLRGPQVTGGGGGVPGTVALDSFSGTDEAKLTAAMSYAGAQTYAPTILLGNRLHQFSTTRATYEGFRIQGPPGPGNAEKSAKANNCRIELNGLPAGAAWLDTGITTSGARVSAGKIAMTGCLFDGWWELNNHSDTTFTVGGSDNTFFMDYALIDSPGSSSPANGRAHVFFDYCEKTIVGPVYMTAAGNWGGFRQDGPAYNTDAGNLGGPIYYNGLRLEGRNATAGTNNVCNGTLFNLDGGAAVITDSWTSYAMGGPLPAGSEGVIDVDGGAYLQLKGCHYDKATDVAETVPYVHVSSGFARIEGILKGGKGGAFTGNPRVTNATGTAANVRHDSSVTATTAGTTAGL